MKRQKGKALSIANYLMLYILRLASASLSNISVVVSLLMVKAIIKGHPLSRYH